MGKKRLIICGNGFDLNHGLKTCYNKYRSYLENNNTESYIKLKNVVGALGLDLECQGAFWNNIEKSLTEVYKKIIDYVVNNKDDFDHSFLDDWLNCIYGFTGFDFIEWLDNTYHKNISQAKVSPEFAELFSDAVMVNFNYTATIKELYSVNSENIFHIHGDIESIKSKQKELKIGDDKLDANITRSRIDFGVSSIGIKKHIDKVKQCNVSSSLIIDFETGLTKHITAKNIMLREFISNHTIEEVVILGHSLSGDDLYYFKEVILPIYKDKYWKFYYYDPNDMITKYCFAICNNINNYILAPFPNTSKGVSNAFWTNYCQNLEE